MKLQEVKLKAQTDWLFHVRAAHNVHKVDVCACSSVFFHPSSVEFWHEGGGDGAALMKLSQETGVKQRMPLRMTAEHMS